MLEKKMVREHQGGSLGRRGRVQERRQEKGGRTVGDVTKLGNTQGPTNQEGKHPAKKKRGGSEYNKTQTPKEI